MKTDKEWTLHSFCFGRALRIFIVSKVHAVFCCCWIVSVLVLQPQSLVRERARSDDLTTHLYFIWTFPIAIKIKTLCVRIECKQTASHSHQFMRYKQTIRSNNARQVLAPTIPLLIGKLICYTITCNRMPVQKRKENETNHKARQSEKKRNRILFRMRTQYSLHFIQITFHFGWTLIPLPWTENWIVVVCWGLCEAIRAPLARTKRIILCTK